MLLAIYLIRVPGDTAPRLLFPLFILITVLASFSLIVIIHNSFAVSMNARVHQFGIFFQYRSYPEADKDVPYTGSGCIVRCSNLSRKFAGNCKQYGNFTNDQYSAGKRSGRKTGSGFWLSSAGSCPALFFFWHLQLCSAFLQCQKSAQEKHILKSTRTPGILWLRSKMQRWILLEKQKK